MLGINLCLSTNSAGCLSFLGKIAIIWNKKNMGFNYLEATDMNMRTLYSLILSSFLWREIHQLPGVS